MKSKIERLGKVSITVEKDYWDKNKAYNRLTIVERQGTRTAYLSRKVVPIGVDIADRNYWITISKWADIPYEIVQGFGDSIELVISQKVVTLKINELQELINNINEVISEGGSIDERIATAKSEVKSDIVDGASENANTFKKVEDALDERYTKEETYSKEQLNSLITTPNQKYVTVDEYSSLPESGEADTTYKVANWDGSLETPATDITKYSEYAWNGTEYVFLSVKSQIGEVFDISAANSGATYTDLATALGTNGANVPSTIRKGGMSIKFIQSSDNRYIQYVYTSSSTTNSNISNTKYWLEVGEIPMANIAIHGKISIQKSSNTVTVIIPALSVITYKKESYELAEDITVSGSISTNIFKVFFNYNTKLVRIGNKNTYPTVNEILLFSCQDNLKIASLPINYYTWNGINKIDTIEANALESKIILSHILNTPVSVNYQTGWYIKTDGTVGSSSNWYHSDEISLAKDQTVLMLFNDTGTAVSPISLVTGEVGSRIYTPVCIRRAGNYYHLYSYTATSACTVLLCSNSASNPVYILNENGYIIEVLQRSIEGLEERNDTINNILKNVTLVTLDTVQNAYINPDGTVVSSSNWHISSPVHVTVGTIIAVSIRQSGTAVQTISKVATEGSITTYTPALITKTTGYHNLKWVADEDCDVVFCYRYSYDAFYIIDYKNNLFGNIYNFLNEIDVLKESVNEYTLPSSWSNKIDNLNIFKGKMFSFLIQTDTHYIVGDGEDYGNNVKEMAKHVPFDFVANLGDIIEGYASMTKELYRESISEIMKRYTKGLPCPFFYTKGNHEHNSMYAGTLSDPTEGYIYDGELWNRTILPSKNTTRDTVYPGRTFYYYYDFEDLNVRAIFVNTNDAATSIEGIFGFGISDAQLAWFTNVALNTTKAVAIYSHVPLIQNLDPEGDAHNNNASIRKLLVPIKSFVDNGGTVIGCFCGHIHMDAQNTHDGINHISFDNGPVGNAVLVDQVNRKIYIKSLGYSNDREFTY